MNWASEQAGCKVIKCSSEVEGCEAKNVLEDNRFIWLSEETLPQSIDLSLLNTTLYSQEGIIRTVGWYVWHAYTTNPHKVSHIISFI